MTSLSRKRTLQDLIIQRRVNNKDNFPSLFNLAVQACISNLQFFATFEGLPFLPFGKALFLEFAHQSNQWCLTTEQRQAGILLFAEAYACKDLQGSELEPNLEQGEGYEYSSTQLLGPEYTGLKCQLAQDVPYLSVFAHCLVYLDLSKGSYGNSNGGVGQQQQSDHTGMMTEFADKDMAGLSSLSSLRILNLANLKNIGDIGLSHLIRSVTFGSSGPAGLEYLNLTGTNITDAGLTKLFVQAYITNTNTSLKHQRHQLVFKRLLGIDLSNTGVSRSVAENLFIGNSIHYNHHQHHQPHPQISSGWRALDHRTCLFPSDVTNRSDLKFMELEWNRNPIEKWYEWFNRSYRLEFAQRPDLSAHGKDGLGLAECLALLKLSQIHLHPVTEQPSPFVFPHSYYDQHHHHNSSNISGSNKHGYSINNTKYMKSGSGREQQQRRQQYAIDADLVRALTSPSFSMVDKSSTQPINLNDMYNLIMYKKVLDIVRETAGIDRSRSRKIMTTPFKKRLAFIRTRKDAEELLLFTTKAAIDKLTTTIQVSGGPWPSMYDKTNSNNSLVDMTKRAKIRNRHHRTSLAPPSIPKSSPFFPLSTSHFIPVNPSSPKSPYLHRLNPHPSCSETELQEVSNLPLKRLKLPSSSSPSPSPAPSSLFIEQEPRALSQQHLSVNNLPGRRRGGTGGTNHHLPFVKPEEKQRVNDFYFKETSTKEETKPPQPIVATVAATTTDNAFKGHHKPPSSMIMEKWIARGKVKSQFTSSTSTAANSITATAIAATKSDIETNIIKTSNGNVIREFHFNDQKQSCVNLTRWIHSFKEPFDKVEMDTRKIIRFDSRRRFSANDDDDVSNNQGNINTD
ncbi:hypothetical protein BX616_001193 [Lobosporangium transversale]|uniref:Uncharacterized protein n=1 Tax=Lobosporangium transversale TaxID=64571 RepID=A0A1Y2GSI2_9FUNG|nr:hypothetical protein BCR41DRAFT_351176 [Lobosporangium transversale]KAF9917379.1 hypothetical protein BX616_001193 [Lobosporangium transversale]ORZ20051.1 hypothetical protein BCR41DRAFT_351176 [Lobosporangium transversale]|eukprot:XP_021882591.1 hypothetical protein BCR41DRAFT_351176 [Lobosporangium transversale]